MIQSISLQHSTKPPLENPINRPISQSSDFGNEKFPVHIELPQCGFSSGMMCRIEEMFSSLTQKLEGMMNSMTEKFDQLLQRIEIPSSSTINSPPPELSPTGIGASEVASIPNSQVSPPEEVGLGQLLSVLFEHGIAGLGKLAGGLFDGLLGGGRGILGKIFGGLGKSLGGLAQGIAEKAGGFIKKLF